MKGRIQIISEVSAAELEAALDAYDVMLKALHRDEVVPVLLALREALKRQLAAQHQKEARLARPARKRKRKPATGA